MPFFTIMVPVYNVQSYLRQCLDSILAQSFSDYEIIVINDGSTDESKKICDEYAKIDSKLWVIHKDNGGLSDARNVGMKNASGEYLIFVDGDDYIDPDSLYSFHEALSKNQNVDVLVTRLMKFYSNGSKKFKDQNWPLDKLQSDQKDKVISWIFQKSQTIWPAQRYIVRKNFIYDNELEFKKGFYHEDIDWTSQLFLYANQFAICNYYWYSHRVGRAGSITTRKNIKKTLDIIDLVQKNINDRNFEHMVFSTRKVIFERLVFSLYVALGDYKYFEKQDKKRVLKTLVKNADVLIYTKTFKHKVFLYFCKLFGFKTGLKIVGIIHKS